MRTITVKNIPDDVYNNLKKSATENRRSINSEIIICIERNVQSRKRKSIESILAQAEEMRRKSSNHVIADAEFSERKAVGRA